MRGRPLERSLPALVGVLATAIPGVAMWRSPAPWTFTHDTGSVFLGQTVPAFREWFAGRVPHWTDLLWGGFPLIGDCTTAALYPPYALVHLATLDAPLRFFDVAWALHLGLFAAGAVALVLRIGGSPAAAAFAGVLAAMDPFGHYCSIAHFPVFAAHAWWPWAFLAAESLTRPATPALGAAMTLGWIALAAQVLAGVPEQATYCAVPAALWILLRRSPLGVAQRVGRAALLGIGATALAAPQLLPTALVLPWTHRAGEPPQYQLGSLWLTQPRYLFLAGTGVLNGLPAFLGVVTPLLGVVAVLARRPAAVFLAGVAIVGFALSLGPQVGLYELVHRIPPFGFFRNPGKVFALATYATLWVAALGADALWRRGGRLARAAAVILVVGSLAEHAVYLPLEVAAMRRLIEGDGLSPERYRRLAELAQLRRTDRTTPPAPVQDFGGALGGEYARNVGALLGIASLHAGSVALLSPQHLPLLTNPTPAILDVVGAHYALAPQRRCKAVAPRVPWPTIESRESDCVLANPAPGLRHAILTDVVRVESRQAMVATLWTKSGGVPIVAPPEVPSPGRGVAKLRSYEPGAAELMAAVWRSSLLLVRDSFAPGWRATVDGQEVTLYPAAGIYFAVPVPAGVHRVRVEYRTPGFREGCLVAAAWIAGAGAATVLVRRRRRQATAAG